MKVIGITGGVGAGKSSVLALLKEMCSCDIIQADLVARNIYPVSYTHLTLPTNRASDVYKRQLYRQTLLQEIYTTQVILDLKRSLIYSGSRL